MRASVSGSRNSLLSFVSLACVAGSALTVIVAAFSVACSFLIADRERRRRRRRRFSVRLGRLFELRLPRRVHHPEATHPWRNERHGEDHEHRRDGDLTFCWRADAPGRTTRAALKRLLARNAPRRHAVFCFRAASRTTPGLPHHAVQQQPLRRVPPRDVRPFFCPLGTRRLERAVFLVLASYGFYFYGTFDARARAARPLRRLGLERPVPGDHLRRQLDRLLPWAAPWAARATSREEEGAPPRFHRLLPGRSRPLQILQLRDRLVPRPPRAVRRGRRGHPTCGSSCRSGSRSTRSSR